MQSTTIPVRVTYEIDKRCRRFLWGSNGLHRKIYLVAWEDVCRRKEEGGLGLRMAHQQNKAFMMKLGWGLVNRRDALWVRFMREKYKCGNDVLPKVGRTKSGSQAWKGIGQAWEMTMKGIGWKLGDGKTIRFWEDCWLPNHEKLLHYTIRSVPESMREDKVITYVLDSGDWNWQEFASFLPGTVVRTIQQMRPYVRGEAQDKPRWRGSSNREFSVKSAYGMLSSRRPAGDRFVWKKIWKLHATQRNFSLVMCKRTVADELCERGKGDAKQ